MGSAAKSDRIAAMRRGARGFTILELLAVVAIISILAVLAYATYRKYAAGSRISEATNIVGNIRAAQETRYQEVGVYADISNGMGVGFLYPEKTPTNNKTSWGIPCTWCKKDWSTLAVHPDGPVMFGYATMADTEKCGPTCKGVTVFTANQTKAVDFSAFALFKPWYVVQAWGDTDGNNVPCVVIGHSWNNSLIIDNEGE